MDILVFLADPNRVDDVVRYLLSQGLKIEATSDKNNLFIQTPLSTVLAVSCNAADRDQLHKSLRNHLTQNRIQVYGTVVTGEKGMIWNGGNILPAPTPPEVTTLEENDGIDITVEEPINNLFEHLNESQ